jgi:hypothetical protein
MTGISENTEMTTAHDGSGQDIQNNGEHFFSLIRSNFFLEDADKTHSSDTIRGIHVQQAGDHFDGIWKSLSTTTFQALGT